MFTSNLDGQNAATTTESGFTGDIAMRPFADEFLARLRRTQTANGGVRQCINVLDVGTGTARIPIEICTRRGDIRFTAVDRATRALQTARRNVEQSGMANVIRIEQTEANSLPYEEATFDAVISSSLLHHLANQPAALSEMARVLRPGGLLLVRDTLRRADADQIAQILSRSSCSGGKPQRTAAEVASRAMRDIEEAKGLAFSAGLTSAVVWQAAPGHWMLEFRP